MLPVGDSVAVDGTNHALHATVPQVGLAVASLGMTKSESDSECRQNLSESEWDSGYPQVRYHCTLL